GGRVRSAGRRAGQRRLRPVLEVKGEGAERYLRVVGEGRGQLPCLGVGFGVADQTGRDPVARRLDVDEDPILLTGGGVAAELLAEIDIPRKRVRWQWRSLYCHGSDLRGGGAFDRMRRPLAELG